MAQSVAKDKEFSLGNSRYCIRNGQFCDAAGEPVALRAKSAQLLDYLLLHNQMLVSKDTLASAVWPQSVASDESISQCISDIRKALGDDSHSILETFPKRGYRLNAVFGESRFSQRKATYYTLIFAATALIFAAVVIAIFNKNDSPLTTTVELLQPVNTVAQTEMESARKALSHFTYEDNLKAERLFRTVIERDPENALAYAELVAAFAIRLENNWAVLTRADEERAFFYAKKAIELNPELWLAHYAIGRLHTVVSDSDLILASKHLQHAISLRPASDDARVYFAAVKNFQGAHDEAISILEAVLASHPNPPFWYFLSYGHTLFQAKRYEEAKAPLSTCLTQMPNAPYCLRFQIANFAQLGQLEDAEWAIEEYVALGYTATVSAIMEVILDRDPGNRKHFAVAFNKAGLRD